MLTYALVLNQRQIKEVMEMANDTYAIAESAKMAKIELYDKDMVKGAWLYNDDYSFLHKSVVSDVRFNNALDIVLTYMAQQRCASITIDFEERHRQYLEDGIDEKKE
jgi:hypothetical protein